MTNTPVNPTLIEQVAKHIQYCSENDGPGATTEEIARELEVPVEVAEMAAPHTGAVLGRRGRCFCGDEDCPGSPYCPEWYVTTVWLEDPDAARDRAINEHLDEIDMWAAQAISELADKCEARINERKHVTFAELDRLLQSEDIDTAGAMALVSGDDPNLILWSCSDFASEVYQELVRRPLVRVDPVSTPLVYVIDGAALNLPVAARPPKGGYKELHWAPVVLNPVGSPRP